MAQAVAESKTPLIVRVNKNGGYNQAVMRIIAQAEEHYGYTATELEADELADIICQAHEGCPEISAVLCKTLKNLFNNAGQADEFALMLKTISSEVTSSIACASKRLTEQEAARGRRTPPAWVQKQT